MPGNTMPPPRPKSPAELAAQHVLKKQERDEERAMLNAFSAHALTGLLGCPNPVVRKAEDIARVAFECGNAMLKEMKKFKAEQESTS